MAATIEALAELAAKGGYKNWEAKFRTDAALFREAGGPEIFDAKQPAEIGPTPAPEPQYRTKTPEKTLDGVIEAYKEQPTNPELVSKFWQLFVENSIAAANVRESDSEKHITVPNVPWLDRTQNELEVLRQEGRMMAYNPGLSYEQLGRVFPAMGSWSVKEESAIEDVVDQAPAWMDVEASIDAPNLGTTQKQLESIFEAAGKRGQKLSTYIMGSQASKVLIGRYFDQSGLAWSRLPGSEGEDRVVAASFRPGGSLNVYSDLDPRGANPSLGGRSEGVK